MRMMGGPYASAPGPPWAIRTGDTPCELARREFPASELRGGAGDARVPALTDTRRSLVGQAGDGLPV